MSNTPDLHEFKTVRQMAEEFPGLVSVSALRWQLRNRDRNGLREHVITVGNKLAIHVPGYTRWLLQQQT